MGYFRKMKFLNFFRFKKNKQFISNAELEYLFLEFEIISRVQRSNAILSSCIALIQNKKKISEENYERLKKIYLDMLDENWR